MFKVGDKVKCVDSRDSLCKLVHNDIYTISDVVLGDVLLEETRFFNWSKHRFILIEKANRKMKETKYV
jgi:hypothetical protein